MNISVLGLGIIGSAWVKNLITDGHMVRCWNRTPKDFPNFTAIHPSHAKNQRMRELGRLRRKERKR